MLGHGWGLASHNLDDVFREKYHLRFSPPEVYAESLAIVRAYATGAAGPEARTQPGEVLRWPPNFVVTTGAFGIVAATARTGRKTIAMLSAWDNYQPTSNCATNAKLTNTPMDAYRSINPETLLSG